MIDVELTEVHTDGAITERRHLVCLLGARLRFVNVSQSWLTDRYARPAWR